MSAIHTSSKWARSHLVFCVAAGILGSAGLVMAAPAEVSADADASATPAAVVASRSPNQSAFAPMGIGARISGQNPAVIMQLAARLEAEGRYKESNDLYKQASAAGYAPASKRLGELGLEGKNENARDYVGAVRWYNLARAQGLDSQGLEKR